MGAKKVAQMLQGVMLNVELFNFILRLKICLHPAAGQRSAAPTIYLQLSRFNICPQHCVAMPRLVCDAQMRIQFGFDY